MRERDIVSARGQRRHRYRANMSLGDTETCFADEAQQRQSAKSQRSAVSAVLYYGSKAHSNVPHHCICESPDPLSLARVQDRAKDRGSCLAKESHGRTPSLGRSPSGSRTTSSPARSTIQPRSTGSTCASVHCLCTRSAISARATVLLYALRCTTCARCVQF